MRVRFFGLLFTVCYEICNVDPADGRLSIMIHDSSGVKLAIVPN